MPAYADDVLAWFKLTPKVRVAAVHLSGEAVCYYPLATVEAGAAEPFASDPVFGTPGAVGGHRPAGPDHRSRRSSVPRAPGSAAVFSRGAASKFA